MKYHRTNRRFFVCMAISLAFAGTVFCEERSIGDLQKQFASPSDEYRPRTRWWWLNGAVTKDEISRELKLMKEAGLSGAEICPHPGTLVPKVESHVPQKIASPEWINLVAHAVVAAGEAGMKLDVTPCDRWPYHGEWVTDAMAMQSLVLVELAVKGPQKFSGPVPILTDDHPVISKKKLGLKTVKPVLEAVVLWQGGEVPGKVLTDAVKDGVLSCEIPEGEWKLMAYWSLASEGNSGGKSRTIDHYSSEAMKFHLDRTIQPILDKVPKDLIGKAFESVYMDNIEGFLGDAFLWTPKMLAFFKERRGYDLAPYLPLILGADGKDKKREKTDTAGTSLLARVQDDLAATRSELNLENCFVALREWCHSKGLTARAEGHQPAQCDYIDAFGVVDIPEMEFFGSPFYKPKMPGESRGKGDIASSAHIYGRKVVSCESFTWMAPHFRGSLAQYRRTADYIFSMGVNQIVHHGYTYSPPEAGFPGWHFYASSNLNHNNPLWKHYRALSDHIARNALLMRHGAPVVPLACYGSSSIRGYADSSRKMDRISRPALLKMAQLEGDRIRVGAITYPILLLNKTQLPLADLQKIKALVEAGGRVALLTSPVSSPGLKAKDGEEAEMLKLVKEIFPNKPGLEEMAVGKGKTWRVSSSQIAPLCDKIGILPQVTGAKCVFEHRDGKDYDAFFVFNDSEDMPVDKAQFYAKGRPEIWSATSGRIIAPKSAKADGMAQELELNLAPGQSALVVFRRDDSPAPAPAMVDGKTVTELGGGWKVRFVHMDGSAPVDKSFDTLKDWTQDADLKFFCGAATYAKTFTLEAVSAGEAIVDLGVLKDSAEVRINGRSLGIVFDAPFQLAVPSGLLKKGENQVEIVVCNRMENGVVKLLPNQGLGNKSSPQVVVGKLEDVGEIHPSGLLGPVKIYATATKLRFPDPVPKNKK